MDAITAMHCDSEEPWSLGILTFNNRFYHSCCPVVIPLLSALAHVANPPLWNGAALRLFYIININGMSASLHYVSEAGKSISTSIATSLD